MMNPKRCFVVLAIVCWSAGLVLAAPGRTNLFDNPHPSFVPLFPDTVLAKGQDFVIKQSQVDEMFLAFKGHRAAMGQAIPDEMRPQIEADILDKLVATQLFLRRATADDKSKAKEIADTFL